MTRCLCHPINIFTVSVHPLQNKHLTKLTMTCSPFLNISSTSTHTITHTCVPKKEINDVSVNTKVFNNNNQKEKHTHTHITTGSFHVNKWFLLGEPHVSSFTYYTFRLWAGRQTKNNLQNIFWHNKWLHLRSYHHQ